MNSKTGPIHDPNVITEPLCSVREFVDVFCDVSEGRSVFVAEFYDAYNTWCLGEIKTPEPFDSFCVKVQEWQPSVRSFYDGPSMSRMFAGIGLVPGLF